MARSAVVKETVHFSPRLTERVGKILLRAKAVCGSRRGEKVGETCFTVCLNEITCKKCLLKVSKIR